MKRKREYGYKVCYREKHRFKYRRLFLAYTYPQAKSVMKGYIRYPPRARDDGHKLDKPKWRIIPVSKKENDSGIWRECPF